MEFWEGIDRGRSQRTEITERAGSESGDDPNLFNQIAFIHSQIQFLTILLFLVSNSLYI